MATTTLKMGLRKPAGTDLVNVQFDLSDNFEKIDNALGEKKNARRVSGDMTVTTAFDHLPANGDTSLDLLLTAKVGDWIEVAVSGFWNQSAGDGIMDVYSHPTSGTRANSWGGIGDSGNPNSNGIMAWYGTASISHGIGGGVMKQVTGSDLTGNILRLGLWARCTSVTKILQANALSLFEFRAINHGQP